MGYLKICYLNCTPIKATKTLSRCLVLLHLRRHQVHGTIYKHLRTYNGRVYDTFQAACRARELVDTDDECDFCLDEAASFQTRPQFRQQFVTIPLMNDP